MSCRQPSHNPTYFFRTHLSWIKGSWCSPTHKDLSRLLTKTWASSRPCAKHFKIRTHFQLITCGQMKKIQPIFPASYSFVFCLVMYSAKKLCGKYLSIYMHEPRFWSFVGHTGCWGNHVDTPWEDKRQDHSQHNICVYTQACKHAPISGMWQAKPAELLFSHHIWF